MFFMQTSGIHIQRIITTIKKMLDTPTAQSAPVFPCVKVTWSFGAFKFFFFFSSCCRDNSDESFLCLDYYDPRDLHTGKLAISCFRVLHSYSLSRKNGLIWICAAQNSISCSLSPHPFDFNLNISIIFSFINVNNEHPTEEKI